MSSHTRAKSATLPRNISLKSNSSSNQFGGAHPRRSNDELLSHQGAKISRAMDANRLNRSPSKSDTLREHVNSLQNSTTKATIRAVNPPQLNNEPGIVDGYLENVRLLKMFRIENRDFCHHCDCESKHFKKFHLQSSEVLKIQLQNAHTVMTITRLKLIQYLAVFRKHIPGDSTHELHQTMDGIEEVKCRCKRFYETNGLAIDYFYFYSQSYVSY